MSDLYTKDFVCISTYSPHFTKDKVYRFHHHKHKQWECIDDTGHVIRISVVITGIWGDVLVECPTVELENK